MKTEKVMNMEGIARDVYFFRMFQGIIKHLGRVFSNSFSDSLIISN